MSIPPSKSLAINLSLESDYPILNILSGNQSSQLLFNDLKELKNKQCGLLGLSCKNKSFSLVNMQQEIIKGGE